jgi:hypothetical protein
VNRHRFEGTVGELCGWRASGAVSGEAGVGRFCGLNYSASLHYNDDDHPFDAGEEGSSVACLWRLQNVPAGMEALFCLRDSIDSVHNHPSAGAGPDDTVVMEVAVPLAEPPYPDGRLYGSSADAPAEDGGDGGGSWAYEAQAVPLLSRAEAGGPDGSSARMAARALLNGLVVDSGPWPVRQWFCPDGGAPEAWEMPGELVCALNVAGEPFVVNVWWATTERRLVRVTWGELLGMSFAQAADAVEEWIE